MMSKMRLLHSCGTIGHIWPVDMSHNTVKSWKGTSSSLRPVIAVRYAWISSEVAWSAASCL